MSLGSSPSTRLAPRLRWRVLLLLILPTTILLATGGFTDDKRKQRQPGVVYLDCDAIVESSGIALSTRDPEIVWTHNDSGDRPRVFAFNRVGKLIAEVTLADVKNADWEDICSFERDGKHWLAIGDVGDNDKDRKNVEIYVVEEPPLNGHNKDRIKAKVAMELKVRLPGGAVDCEALAYDPLSENFVLCSKEAFRTRLFQVKMPSESGKHESEAKQFGALAMPMATAADISRDGQKLVIATYGPAGILERALGADRNHRKWDTSDVRSFRWVELPARRQGESICFDSTSDSLILTSEGDPTPLHFTNISNSGVKP